MRLTSVSILLILAGLPSWGFDAAMIIDRMEANQVHATSEMEGSFAITDRFGTRTKSFKAFSMGKDKMLIEFTNPEEAGQKILRRGDEIYLYFPEAEEVIRLQGSALKDSVMGSDLSYEDLTGEKGLRDLYRLEAEGSETLDGRECFVVKLTAKKKDIAYPLQRIWVDAELFVLRQASYFSASGKPLKELQVREIRAVSGKTIPTRMEVRDLMKKDSSTSFQIRKITIDKPLDAGIFSREELSW